jgi:hypothetical protein
MTGLIRAAALLVLCAGCNAILGNEEARLADDEGSGDPAGGSGGGALTGGSGGTTPTGGSGGSGAIGGSGGSGAIGGSAGSTGACEPAVWDESNWDDGCWQ